MKHIMIQTEKLLISALSSNNLDKYEYLTGEDLGLKPSTIEQARFEYSPLGKIFNKGLDKDDKKECLFKRLKNIENVQKILIKDDENESIYYAPRSEFDHKDDKDKKQQTNNIDTKPPNIFNYLKSLSQQAKDLMEEIEDADDDIDYGKLLFIGSNKEKCDFNTFRKPLIFISAIYNGEISLKEAKFFQKKLEKIIEDLNFNYKPKNEKEKEEINEVLMQVNDMLEYMDKIIDAFKNRTFLSEYLKKSDDAGYKYVLKDVKKFTQEIESMSEKINLSLFEEFFESSSPADYAKKLINTSPDESKKIVEEIKDRISDLKDRIKKMSETEKKNADETLEIIKKILDYNKDVQKKFQLASKVDKKNQNQRLKKVLQIE